MSTKVCIYIKILFVFCSDPHSLFANLARPQQRLNWQSKETEANERKSKPGDSKDGKALTQTESQHEVSEGSAYDIVNSGATLVAP